MARVIKCVSMQMQTRLDYVEQTNMQCNNEKLEHHAQT